MLRSGLISDSHSQARSALARQSDQRQFDYPIAPGVEAGGFDVDRDDVGKRSWRVVPRPSGSASSNSSR